MIDNPVDALANAVIERLASRMAQHIILAEAVAPSHAEIEAVAARIAAAITSGGSRELPIDTVEI